MSKIKQHLPLILIAVLSLLSCGLWMSPVGAQSADAADQSLPLVQSIAQQQKLIDENQNNIDKNIAAIQEDLRLAKIYVSRSGKAPSK